MPVVTVTSGWKKPENYFSQPNGAYPVTLKRVGASDDQGNFIDGATYEHNGQFGLKVKQSWQFELDNGEIIEVGVAVPNDGKISTNSTYYKYACALVGRSPAVGQSFDTAALIGLRAQAFIQRDDNQVPRITVLGVLEQPAAPVAPVAPAPTPAPAAAPAQPVAAPAQTPDALPF
jgi:hypothetical protein